MPALRRTLPPVIAALALSLGMATAALGSLLDEPHAALIGDWTHPDTLSNHWLLAWVAEQASSGGSLLHNDRYYWPIGDAPLLAGNGAEGFVYLPFHLALGWPGGVAPYVLCVLTMGGFAAYLLARAGGGRPWASLVAVGFFGASPYVFQELSAGRFSQADVAWLLLFLASWLHLLRAPSVRRGVVAGAALAAAGFFYWYYAWFGVLAAVGLWIARGPRSVPWRPLLAVLGVASLALAPWLALHLWHWSSIPGTAEGLFPHPESRLDVATATLAVRVGQGREASRALPWTLWATAVAGGAIAVRAWLRPGGALPRWVAGGLLATWALFFALSFGPAFDLAPYTLLYGVAPVLRRFWWPLRHTVVVHAVLAVFAAVGLSGLQALLARRLGPGRGAVAVGVLATALVVTAPTLLAARSLPSSVASSPRNPPPDVYLRLAELPDGAVVEPPLSPEAAGTQQHLIYQRWHGKRLVSGHALWVDRVRPADWDAWVADNTLLAGMQRLERGELSGALAVDPADLERLRRVDVRWFVLNREHLPLALRPQVQAYEVLFTGLFGEPVLRGRGVKVWDLERWTGARSVALPPTPWPAQLERPRPDQPLVARRPESLLFPEARATGP